MTPIIQKSPITSSEETIIEGKLVRLLRDGLAKAGINTGRRRYGLIFIDSLKWPIAVQVFCYTRNVPVWRILFGGRDSGPWPCVLNPRELTLHLSEFSEETGVALARLLREPEWRWPLFEHDKSYPQYAWSKLAHETYTADRLAREARHKRFLER